jgi:YD repeat-containing protein
VARIDGEGDLLPVDDRPLEGRVPDIGGLEEVANPAGPRSGTRAESMITRVRMMSRRASDPRAGGGGHIGLDAMGHVLAMGPDAGIREEVRYDLYGRPTCWRTLREGREAACVSIEWERGRVVRCHDAAEDVWEIVSYDAAGRPTRVHELPGGAVRTLTYDLRSRPVRECRRIGRRTRELRIEWDLADRERRVLGASEDGVSEIEIEFIYEAGTRVSTVLRQRPHEPGFGQASVRSSPRTGD